MEAPPCRLYKLTQHSKLLPLRGGLVTTAWLWFCCRLQQVGWSKTNDPRSQRAKQPKQLPQCSWITINSMVATWRGSTSLCLHREPETPTQTFYARQHAIARICHGNSVCLFVCLSVHHTRALYQNSWTYHCTIASAGLSCCYNSDNYWPVFKSLSLAHSTGNLQEVITNYPATPECVTTLTCDILMSETIAKPLMKGCILMSLYSLTLTVNEIYHIIYLHKAWNLTNI